MNPKLSMVCLSLRLGIHFSEIQYWSLFTLYQEGNYKKIDQRLVDFGLVKQAFITKFVPGTHYSALARRFNTYGEAEDHLEERGYLSLGLKETFVYKDGN